MCQPPGLQNFQYRNGCHATLRNVAQHYILEAPVSACGSELIEIGKDVRRTLQMKPAEFWVREDVYYTYACKNCEQETGEAVIVKTPKEPTLLPGSFAALCRKRNGRILPRPWANGIAHSFSSWSRNLRS